MFAKVQGLAIWGLDGFPVTVEASTHPAEEFHMEIIGLPDLAVKESRSRILSAMQALSVPVPKGCVTVNLAPADRKKQGSGFDLPILAALLSFSLLKGVDLTDRVFLGEVGLDGTLRAGAGALPKALAARRAGARELFVPKENAAECAVVEGLAVYGAENVREIVSHLTGASPLSATPAPARSEEGPAAAVDFADIRGQEVAKRAMEIAAAGGHNLLLVGPPGSGKSMLAKALPGILPAMTFGEMLQTTAIHSVSGVLSAESALVERRPFRAPHHTMSFAGLVGGGQTPAPGEISLAHKGVLFLDELPEFDKKNLEILRQPLEDRCVTITRAAWKMTFPSDFMLVCAMNPCPCGYYGDPTHTCTCSKAAVEKYLGKISGPLLDRIDMRVEVPALSFDEISTREKAETSAAVRERVNRARALARERGKAFGLSCNGAMTGAQTKALCELDEGARVCLKESFEALNLSARGYDRILRLARTIADLEASPLITETHILEAVQYRVSSEKYFG